LVRCVRHQQAGGDPGGEVVEDLLVDALSGVGHRLLARDTQGADADRQHQAAQIEGPGENSAQRGRLAQQH
jgi:hypothetical protein